MHAGVINEALRGGARLERAEECKRHSPLRQRKQQMWRAKRRKQEEMLPFLPLIQQQ